LTQLKARSLAGFAALENHPYAEVRQWVRQQLANLEPGRPPTD
jgi:ATP-dependent DNA helicase RecQ